MPFVPAGFLFFTMAAGASAAQWELDRFVISFWVDPMVPVANFDLEYRRIADANFTTLLGGCERACGCIAYREPIFAAGEV